MNEIELEIAPAYAEIIITMPDVASVDLELMPVLVPTTIAEEFPTDPLAYYMLAKG